MATTSIGSSGVTFPDATVQASKALPGILGQFFSSSGTFTLPTGVSAIKVTVCGGGGNSSGSAGGGGGAGGCGVQYYTGLTPGNTLSVTVGAVGGSTSVASGTQTISTVTGAGGGSNSGSTGGTNGGTTNTAYRIYSPSFSGGGDGRTDPCSGQSYGGSGGVPPGGNGASAQGASASTAGTAATGYGGGKGGNGTGSTSGGAGTGGYVLIEW